MIKLYVQEASNKLYRKLHRVRKKRGHGILGITLTNLAPVCNFLARIILIFQSTKPLENLARHCNIVTWRWRHIWRHQKYRLQAKTDI